MYHFQASDTRNIVMLAVKSKEPLTSTTLKNKVAALRAARPKLPKSLGSCGRIRAQAPKSAANAGVLTDDFAPPGGLLKSKKR